MDPVEPVVLTGRWVRLEPLRREHLVGLRAITDPELYRWLPDVPDDVDGWFEQVHGCDDPLFFAAMAESAVGRAALMNVRLPHGVAEIGHVLWGPAMRRTPASSEAVFLLCDYLFGLGARRVEWKCNNRNEASKAAALRFGFTFEGVFRQHMIVKGENRDTAWFSLLDDEWPRRRAALQSWLEPGNFDSRGRQRSRLSELGTASLP